MIGETPTLDFREENEDADKPLTEEERKQIDEKNAEQKKKAEDAYARVKNGASFEDIAKQESDDETSKAKGGDLGFLIGQGAYRGLLERLKPVAVGSVFEGVVDDGANYYVAKVEERKPAGLEIRASHILIQWAGSSGSSSTSTKEQAKARIEELKKTVTAENFDEMVQKFSQEPGANQSKGDLDWFAKGVMVPEFEETALSSRKIRFRTCSKRSSGSTSLRRRMSGRSTIFAFASLSTRRRNRRISGIPNRGNARISRASSCSAHSLSSTSGRAPRKLASSSTTKAQSYSPTSRRKTSANPSPSSSTTSRSPSQRCSRKLRAETRLLTAASRSQRRNCSRSVFRPVRSQSRSASSRSRASVRR